MSDTGCNDMQDANFLDPCVQSTCSQNYKVSCKCTKYLRMSNHGHPSLLVKCSHCSAGSLAWLCHPCPALPWLRGNSLGGYLQFLGKFICLRPWGFMIHCQSYCGITSVCVANSHYLKIAEHSQPITQVKAGPVQQNEQHEMRAPSGFILRAGV